MNNVNHYLALYRKYRPEKFEDVAGQSIVVKILKNSLLHDRVSHAYLFSGPRGTGKTTIAKLLARLVNCENRNEFSLCGKCDSCVAFIHKNNPDVIEIDAASNNGVDEIREIRDKASLLPTFSKYKIYIIDEVHMLSTGAFNALLKTLEEPPEHVIFILATTEFYKVPETIVSRCQCFDFERISDEDMVSRLKYIAEKEKISIDDEVFSLIAHYSDGGMRDAISLLDKLSCCTDVITKNDFYDLKGIVQEEDFQLMLHSLLDGNVHSLLDVLDRVLKNGKNVILLCENFLEFLKNDLVAHFESFSQNSFYYDLLDLFSKLLIEMKNSSYPKILFEVGLLKACKIVNTQRFNFNSSISDSLKRNVSDSCIKENDSDCVNLNSKGTKEEFISKLSNKNRLIRIHNAFALANKSLLITVRNAKDSFQGYLHDEKFALVVGYIIDCHVRVVGDDTILLSAEYDSIVDQIHSRLDKVEELFFLVLHKKYKIVCVSNQEWNSLKLQYIEDKNNGIIYEYWYENNENSDIIENELSITKEDDEIVSSATSLFGNDIVEIE